jgi:hypothetical protein
MRMTRRVSFFSAGVETVTVKTPSAYVVSIVSGSTP